MNFRPTAQLREMHDDARCPDSCPLCAQIDAAKSEPRGPRDHLTTADYPER
jgi:hypothetical protein